MGLCTFACSDPARTDGTVTAWIGENNEMFLKCTDGVKRKLSTPMEDILGMTEAEVLGLTRANQIVSVKKDGTGYSILTANATDEEIAAGKESFFELQDGKLSVGEAVYSERAAAAATDGLLLYWINKSDAGYVLMYRELPGQEQAAAGRAPISLNGRSVPEPKYLCVTGEALTVTATDHSVVSFSLQTGEYKSFLPSGQMTAAACMEDGRLYRYISTDEFPWVLETIQNDAMLLTTVTPAPATAVPTATPTATVRPTPAPTPTPRRSSGEDYEDTNIYKGARGSTVRKIQRRLKDLGYPVGSVDGIYGEQTQLAVNLFYDAIYATEHNYITRSMRNKLFAKSAPQYDPYLPLQKGDKGLSVLYMQMMLRKLGFDPVKVDGVYGELTIQAVAAYQKAIGYKWKKKEVPGEYASHDLLERLFGPDPTPKPSEKPTNSTNPQETETTKPEETETTKPEETETTKPEETETTKPQETETTKPQETETTKPEETETTKPEETETTKPEETETTKPQETNAGSSGGGNNESQTNENSDSSGDGNGETNPPQTDGDDSWGNG